jgi:transposase, IS30 family
MTPKFNHLSQDQRYQIEALLTAGHKQTYIADYLSVNKSTICREIKRNSTQTAKLPNKYKASQAQHFAQKRAYKPDKPKSSNKDIQRRLIWLLKHDWSPEQIALVCAHRGLQMLSTEGIYLWIYEQKRIPVDFTDYLRRHHRKRRKRRLKNQPRSIIKNKVSIHDRPPEVAEQQRFGDVETDLVKCQNGYLLTITERKSLYNLIVKLPNKEALTIQMAMIEALNPIKNSIKTITSDNGTEFAYHQTISESLGVPWYFADPYCSQQRGCNENQNGLIRQYFKRDKDLNTVSIDRINQVQEKLNNRPRKKNNFVSPNELLFLHGVAFAA